MDVGELVARIVTTLDPKGLDELNARLGKLAQTSTQAGGAVGAVGAKSKDLDLVTKAATEAGTAVEKTTGVTTGLVRAFGILAQSGLTALKQLADGITNGPLAQGLKLLNTAVIQPLANLARGALEVVNPLNLVHSAMIDLHTVMDVALGVALFDSLRQITQAVLQFTSALTPLSTGVFAGDISVKMAALSATVANMGLSFDSVAQSVNNVRFLGIQASSAIQAVTQGLQVGINPTQIEKLARAGQDLAQVIGTDSSTAFDRLFQAIVTGNTEMLRFAGIMKTQEQIIAEYSAKTGLSAQQIKANVNDMRQAFLNAILDDAGKFAGAYEASLDQLGKKLTSYQRQFDDLRLGIGKIFEPFISGAFTIVQDATEKFSSLFFVTQKGAQAAAAASLSASNHMQLTAKDVSDLSTALLQGGAVGEATFKRIAASAGTSEDALKKLAATGALSADAIAKLGNAYGDTPLTQQLRGLSYGLGSIIQGITNALANDLFSVSLDDMAKWAPEFVNKGVQAFANLLTGVLSFINNGIIPGIISFLQQLINLLTGQANNLLQLGADLGKKILDGISSALATGASLVSKAISDLAGFVTKGFANALFVLGDAKNWGSDIAIAVSNGITASGSAVVSAATEAGAAAISAASSVTTYIQPIKEWGKGVVRAVLESLRVSDISTFNFLGGFIDSLFGQGAEEQTQRATRAVAEALKELQNGGHLTAAALQELKNAFGAAFGDVDKYIELSAQLNDGLEKQFLLQQDITTASEKVQLAEQALRDFELGTADIPERYTRGRQQQLQVELNAAQREQQAKELALQRLQQQNELNQRAVQLQQAYLEALLKSATAEAAIALRNPPKQPDLSSTLAAIDAAVQQLGNQFRAELLSAFAPVREQFLELGAFLYGLLGLQEPDLARPTKLEGETPGEYAARLHAYEEQKAKLDDSNKKGLTLRETFLSLVDIVKTDLAEAWTTIKGIIDTVIDRVTTLIGLVKAFVAGLTGGPDPAKSGDPLRGGGQIVDPAKEAAYKSGGAVADFAKQFKPVLDGLEQFAKDHRGGVKLIGGLILGDILTGGALHAAALTIITGIGGAMLSIGGPLLGVVFGNIIVGALSEPALGALIAGATTAAGDILATLGGLILAAASSVALWVGLGAALLGGIIFQLLQSAGIIKGESILDMFTQAIYIAINDPSAFKDVATQFWQNFGGAVHSLWEDWKALFFSGPLLVGWLTKSVLDAVGGVVPGLKPFIDEMEKPFLAFVDWLVGHSLIPDLLNTIVQLFTNAPSTLTGPVAAVISAIQAPFAGLSKFLVGDDGGGGIFGAAKNALGGIWSKITGGGGSGSQPAANTNVQPDLVSQAVAPSNSNPFVNLNSQLQTVLTQIKTTIDTSNISNKVKDVVTDPVGALFQALNDDVSGTKGTVPTMLGRILSAFIGLAPALSIPMSVVSAVVTGVFSSAFTTVENSVGPFVTTLGTDLDGISTSVNGVGTAFSGLGTTISGVLTAAGNGIITAAGKISTSLTSLSIVIKGLVKDISNSFTGVSDPVIYLMNTFVAQLIALFNQLYDKLMGHSIIPDLTRGIINEFSGLSNKVRGPLSGFKDTVEGQLGSISGKIGRNGALGVAGDHRAAGAPSGLNVTIDQHGWIFPANMDGVQQDTLRKIARDEAYTGIVLAFKGAGG